MSENGRDDLLAENTAIAVGTVGNLAKRQLVHIDDLDMNESPIVEMENTSQQYVTIVASSSQDNILGNVIVNSSRGNQVNGNISSIHNSVPSTQVTYGSLHYVQNPVVSLQEDHQSKFSDGLIPVNFVDLNETAIKSSSGANPLELYFDVPVCPMSTSSTNSNIPSTTTGISYLPRHEHQTPKSQILVRAYSDYIQPQEQQDLQDSQVNEHTDSIIPSDVLDSEFVQLEQAVPMTEFRKVSKYESPKRHIQINVQKQIQNYSHNSLEVDDESVYHHSVHHNSNQQDNLKQTTYVPPQQYSSKYHLQKQYSQQLRHLDEESLKDEVINQNNITHYNHHNKNMQTHQVVGLISQNFNEQNISKSQSISTHNMPLVSRSGRLIRRKPEYIEYVNQNVKDEMTSDLTNRNSSCYNIKIEHSSGIENDDDLIDDNFEEEHEISNSEEHDPSEVYSSDGKKSLPHKKRIPKKLKNDKKQHVKSYKCCECGEQFVNQNQFQQHKQSHIQVKHKFICEICNKSFEAQLRFFEHLKTHYEPFKKHKCEVCEGEFASAESLQEHCLVHTKEHFKCNVCHKTFRKESMLEVHIKVAHLEEDSNSNNIEQHYTCSVCPKSFKSQLTLDTHVQSDHSEELPEFNCDDCYRVFKSKIKLNAHRKVEHKEEVTHGRGAQKKKLKLGKHIKDGFACTLCPRTFIHKNSLIYHIRGHTGERPHQCEQCGKAFFAASALKVHLRLHSGEKPYKCETCGKFFRQWGDLKYHTTSVHSDNRQFQCEFCGKDFKRKYCLVVHRRIHTGEKKYKCEFCQKTFRASSYLQNHKRIHTGERPYPCPDCGKPFRVRSDMKRHRNTHLRDNNNTANTSSSNTNSGNSSNNNNVSHTSGTTTTPVRPTKQINQNPVQLLQGSVTSGQMGQLIIADGVQTVIGDNQPIRIMVSGINQSHNSQPPPPAHKHSQVTPVSPGSPSTSSSAISTHNLTPGVIFMDQSSSQPINLNILPRMISSANSNHSVTTNEEVNDNVIFIQAPFSPNLDSNN